MMGYEQQSPSLSEALVELTAAIESLTNEIHVAPKVPRPFVKRPRRLSNAEQVYVLVTDEEQTAEEIAAAWGRSQPQTRRELNRLEADGRVLHSGRDRGGRGGVKRWRRIDSSTLKAGTEAA